MVFSPLGEVIKSVGNIEVLRTRNLKQFNAYFVLFGKTETLSSYRTNCRSFSKPSAAAVAVVAFNEINDFIRT